MAQIPGAEFQATRFVGEDPVDGIVAVIAGDGSVQIVNSWEVTTGDVYYLAPAGTNGGGGTRRHRLDGPTQVNTGTRAVPVYSDVITSAGGVVTGTIGIGVAAPAGVDLNIQRASDAAGVGAPTIRLRNTLSSGAWSTAAPWAKVEFYSDDASAPGALVRASLAVRYAEAAGQSSVVELHTSDATNAIYPVLSLDRGMATVTRFSAVSADGVKFIGRRAMGTTAAPTMYTASGRLIASLEGHGYTTTGGAYVAGGTVSIESDSVWTDGTSYPTRIVFSTIAAGSTTLTERWRVSSPGHLLAGADNAYDIGASGATRPRHVFIGSNLTVGGTSTLAGNLNLNARLVSVTGDTVIARMQNSAGAADVRTWDFRIQNDGSFELRSIQDPGTTVSTPITFGHATGAITLNGNITSTITHTGGTANLGQLPAGSGSVNVGDVTSSSALINLRSATGTRSQLTYRTGNVLRWSLYKSETAEGGANSGSNFAVSAYDDAGAFIDFPLFVTRAAGGAIAFASARPITGGTYNGQTISSAANFTGTLAVAGTLTHAGFTANLAQTATSADVNIGTGTGSGNSTLSVKSAAGTIAFVALRTASAFRWAIFKNTTAETGSDAGSNLAIGAYDDAGAFIDNPISITRAAGGAISVTRPVRAATDNAVDIGSSGANRFRDLFLGRNAVIGGSLIVATATPASAAAAGTAGTIAWDSGFLYVCVATNTWKRVAIATW